MTDSSLHGKVVVLGLDGGTWDLLRKFAHEGVMPNLASALERYPSGDLQSCLPPYSAPGWTTITTGLDPGRHGIFDFYRDVDGVRTPISLQSTTAQRIWSLASDAGKTVHVFNVPVSYPPSAVNGTFVSGLLTPSVEAPFTHPPNLREELLALPGGYDPDPYAADQMWGRFLTDAAFWVHQKEVALRRILARSPWDLLFSVIQDTDPLQHKFWFAMDELDPRHDRKVAARYRDGIRRVYRLCDDVIGHRLAMAERGATVLLISDHGFGRYEKYFYINRVLEDAGLLARNTSHHASRRVSPMAIVRATRRLDVFGLEERIPVRIRERLLSTLDTTLGSTIDWDRTVAFAGASSAECVFINDRVVDRTEACRRAVDALESARDSDTGSKVIERAIRREDLYTGEDVRLLPDIILDFGDRPYLGSERVSAQKFTERLGSSSGGGRHRRTGIILAAGPGLVSERIENARIADIFPTVAHALNLPVPEGLDGHVIPGIGAQEIRYGDPISRTEPCVDSPSVYSPDDEKAIEASLRGLGYIE